MSINKENRRYIRYFPLIGCVSFGAIYVSVGVIALLALFRIKEGGADDPQTICFSIVFPENGTFRYYRI